MRALMCSLLGILAYGVAGHSFASPITYSFSQDGFSSGGSISGFFSGRDLDGDGQLYAVSRGISEIFGLPFGNELDYAEVTFEGFGDIPGESTVVYDKSVADMESPLNLFMAFAYNLDGGELGDDPDEGLSLSRFSPSTNYWLGEAFTFVFENESSELIGACGTAPLCGGVLGLVPDEASPIGAVVVYEDFSGESVATVRVPVPGVLWLMLGGLAAIGLTGRKTRAG
jgi:hypothetical protein